MALELERHPDAAKNFAGIHVATVVSAGAEELVARALPSLLRYVAGVVVGTAAIEETLKKHDDAFKEEDKRYGIFPLSQGEFKVNSRTEISGLNSKSETDPGICKHPHPYDAEDADSGSIKQKFKDILDNKLIYGSNPTKFRDLNNGVIHPTSALFK
ncbi:MAG: hypothetical protein SFT93_00040 [Rickettsiaceae bacterium]|nr:hypothetical protein [Rickettsiaceae bacterium]